MCGIAAIFGPKATNKGLSKMLKAQKHRGPDHTGIWSENEVFLGHNRLSIIDLSKAANQPFTDVNNRYHIIFNGEIYNYLELKDNLKYPFRTSSDTEVLLAAYIEWGHQCLGKLNGMFSFAIWDTKEETLFAARDRFGVKPFYYHQSEADFYVASEIKSLFTAGVKKTPNNKVWANYFSFGSYGMPNETFWEGISQLPGGHFLEYKKGILKTQKWYFFEKEILKYSKIESYPEVKEKYTALLRDSIQLRFRADVPVGFNVSGGVDSSALLAFVNEQNKTENIKGYTFYTDDDRYDELFWVEKMIAHKKNPLQKVLLKADEVPCLSSKIAMFQDEPYGGIPTLAYSKIFQKAREQQVLVLLDGQGMDEQWAGYDYYLKEADNNLIQGVQKTPFRTAVLSKEMKDLSEKPIYPEPFNDSLLNKQYRDLFYTKIPRALRFNDRISMAYSTELREPFLDYRLVEFAFAQPLTYKIKEGVQKKLLREIVSEHLSDSISYAPKRPLQTPQREWLGDELKEFVVQQISVIENSKYNTWFDIQKLRKEWQNYLGGDMDSSFHVWQWVSLGLLINEKKGING